MSKPWSCCGDWRSSVALAVIAVVAPAAARAEPSSSPDVPAVRVEDAAIRLDGTLDEPAWQRASVITGTTSFEPAGGAPAASQLRALVFYDGRSLYVGARITTPPNRLRGRLAPREQWDNDDLLEVMIDPYLDRRTGYAFTVNPYGVQLDWTIDDDDWSSAWDGVWDASTQRHLDGFTVEMRIPFRTLRFAPAAALDWGFGLGVYSGVAQQYDKWPPMSRDRGAAIAQLGTLRGLTGLHRSYNVDVIPTLTTGYGGSAESGTFTWDDPLIARTREPGIIDAGLDVAWGVTSGTRLNLTVNPDFSQIEADAEQLEYNLRFPIVLEEKRGFFLEGVGVFATPVSLLYTRSIVDPIAGLKVSGRTGAWSYGMLSTYDQLPLASQLVEPTRPSGFEDLSQRDAVDTIARVALGLDGGGSRIGLFVADKSLRDRTTGQFTAHNEVIAADASLAFREIYFASAQAGVSHIGGEHDFNGLFYALRAKRHSTSLLLDLRTDYYSEGFRAETSALTRSNIVPSTLEASYRYFTGSEAVTYLDAGAVLASVQDAETLDLLDGSIKPTIGVHIGDNTDLSAYYSRGQETYVREFTGIDQAGAELTTYPVNALALSAKLFGGDQINYDPEDLYLGTTLRGDLRATLVPLYYLQLQLGYTKSYLWRDTGDLDADVDLYYGKLGLSLSNRWSLRLISQLDTDEDVLRNSALLSYVVHPGTELYLGYQENDAGVAGTGAVRPLDRRMFLKASYRWQL